jgi:hypothetical protein
MLLQPRDFLPRGSGIVTRRPLVLQLHHRVPNEGSDGTWDVDECVLKMT